MKTYKYIALAALALGFTACTQDDDFAPQQEDIVQIASANIATEVQTRVNTLDDGTQWENNDQILLVNNSRDNKNSGTYTYNGTTWSLAEGLVLYASGAYATNDFTAYYPAVADEYYNFPINQSTEAEFKRADRMVATATGVEKGAAVALSFERRNAMITIVPKIAEELTGQSVSGLQIASITPYHPADAEGYTAIIAPSDEGFEVKVKVGDSDEPLTATTSTAIEAGKHYTFNLKVGKDLMTMETVSVAPWNQQEIGDGNAAEIPYLTFTADAKQTMKIAAVNSNPYWDESMEYSVNGGKWAQLAAGTDITFGGDEGTLRLRGKSLNGTSEGGMNHSKVSFGYSNVKVACSGDIRTLVDYANYATVSTANAKFCFLFDGCTSLTTAPELPATELAYACYGKMFLGCTSLTTAPELPATTLAEQCYNNMFYGCTSLTEAPELPAKTLAEKCYINMFYGCTSLTEAPELPATTLTQGCYNYMFYGCTSLTNAPELPATALGENCYDRMFYGCTNLTEAPELPATTLARGCYNYMFGSCTSLTTAPELPATKLVFGCYQRMFDGCTSLTEAPELPATTLAEHCYNGMFFNCTGLTEAPELPAKTLVNSCYKRMFNGCSSLNNITMLATNISATDCLLEWVLDVASTGTFYKNSGATWDVTGTVPEGWTVENYTAPEE